MSNVANLGLDYGLVAGWKSWADPSLGELSAFEDVFRMTVALHPEAKVQLGGGAGCGGRHDGPVPPSSGCHPQVLGGATCPKMLWGLVKVPQSWLEEYHRRSRVEAFWHALKARNPPKIRKKVVAAQVSEATVHAVVYNLRKLCNGTWVGGLDPVPNGAGPIPMEA